ncbi:MAG: glycoside hydrolase family 92 protein, partial [Bacteroidaceae bacterium]|nr:glycoside hydrolase family 92 protein [Bacteroidaceae bacterium]
MIKQFLLLGLFLLGIGSTKVYAENVTKYVNPFMGTATLWTPDELGYTAMDEKRAWGAETYPGATLPNALVQLTPVTKYRTGSGYQYEDHQI